MITLSMKISMVIIEENSSFIRNVETTKCRGTTLNYEALKYIRVGDCILCDISMH